MKKHIICTSSYKNKKKDNYQIDSQLNWKKHIDYICKKLSKCVGIIAKARKKLYKSSLIPLYYSFAYPYFIYCNHVWGNTFKTSLEKMVLVQKKLIRIITCSPYRAHTGPLLFANRIMTLSDVNIYMTGIFMYQCAHKNIPNIFQNFFIQTEHSIAMIQDMQMIFVYLIIELKYGNAAWRYMVYKYRMIFLMR